MNSFATGVIRAAILVGAVLAPISVIAGGKEDLVGGMEQFAGIRFTQTLVGDYKSGDTLDAVVTDPGKFRKLGIGAPGVRLGDPVSVKLLDKDSSRIVITDNIRKAGKSFTVGDYGMLTPAPVVAPARGPTLLSRSIPRPPIYDKGAIIVPQENCGTFWTAWGDDPNADVNPCPANCERGERLAVRQSGDKLKHQANYRCYLPELVVRQPRAVARAPGAPPRTNCGTFWTVRQSDPNADANPCPANCERGELLGVKRGRSEDKLHYEMNYRCYMR